jgi:hypothetical protein
MVGFSLWGNSVQRNIVKGDFLQVKNVELVDTYSS